MFESADLGAVTDAARAAVADLEVGTISDDDLLLLVARAEELGRIADALRVRVAGEVAARSRPELGEERLSRSRGCASPAELLERVALIAGATGRARIGTAAHLRARATLTGEPLPAAFPLVADAVDRGDIGIDAAAAIVNALAPIRERLGTSDGTDAAEAALLLAAYGSDSELPTAPDELRIMAQTWALYLDPDGTLPDEDRAATARSLRVGRQRDGVVPIRGELLPDVAAQLERLLDAYLNPKAADTGPRFADDVADDAPRDPRTYGQRRHDAFAGMLQIAAGLDGQPLLGGAAPTLVVTVSADQLTRANGTAFLPTRGDGDSGAISAGVARHTGCAGRIQRVVFDTDGRIIELGAPERIFSGHRRRGIATRDGECIIPACHVPAPWCEVHHVTEHAAGGATHTDNGVLLCWHHHRTLETSGWEIRMIRGVPWVRAPRWLDPNQRWRPTPGSPERRLHRLAERPRAPIRRLALDPAPPPG